MASKGKGKSKLKLKNYEVLFNGKLVNLKRFAYDAIVHLVSRFGVPENCICMYEGPENVYECDDLFMVMSTFLIRHQMINRHDWYQIFESHYQENKFASYDNVKSLLLVIVELSVKFFDDVHLEAELLLSSISEFVLFLYSKNCNLYLRQLASFWFGYLSPMKQKFQDKGGIEEWYKVRFLSDGEAESIKVFHDDFIEAYCSSYEDSAKQKIHGHIYTEAFDGYKAYLAAKYPEGSVPRSETLDPRYTKALMKVTMEYLRLSEQAVASEIDVREDNPLGIRPHEELLQDSGVSVTDSTSSQSLPGTSRQVQPSNRGEFSTRQKKHTAKSGLRSQVDQGFVQQRSTPSGTCEKKTNVSVASDVQTASHNPPGTSSQRQRRTSGWQKPDSSLCSSEEQSLGLPKLDPSRTKGSGKKKYSVSDTSDVPTGYHNPPGTSSQRCRRTSGWPKPESSLCSSGEQSLGQPRLDPSGTKGSGKKKSSLSVTSDVPTGSHNPPETSSQEPTTQRCRRTSGWPKPESSLCSSVEQGLGNLRLDSSETLESDESNPNASLLVQATETQSKITENQPVQKIDEKRKSTSSPGEEE